MGWIISSFCFTFTFGSANMDDPDLTLNYYSKVDGSLNPQILRAAHTFGWEILKLLTNNSG